MNGSVFRDREEAGVDLGVAIAKLSLVDPVVLGLPRGGVPVAAEVARALKAPLDVIVVRKLGVPFQPELAMGAIGEDGVVVVNEDVVRAAGVSEREIAQEKELERAELDRRLGRLRTIRPREPLTGRTAVLVDDGIATGATMRAAVQVARAHGATTVVVAAPVAPSDVVEMFEREADRVVVLAQPEPFYAVGSWYRRFDPVSDDEVTRLLQGSAPTVHREIAVPVGAVRLTGDLSIPAGARGVVLFAHGSGSSRLSPRNRWVAERLQQAGLATLLIDLLTPEEGQRRDDVFDIELLAERLGGAIGFLARLPETRDLPIGLFGASTGAAAALWAAAEPDTPVAAVVSRGGRPDLAGPRLARVVAPTLLLVGGDDGTVVTLNRQAADSLSCDHRLVIVPGATHLFEEPGTLERVADEAASWFCTHFAPAT